MEEKQGIKINLSTFFLILALIVIVIMGKFIYKLYYDNQKSANSIEELNNKITNLESSIAPNNVPAKVEEKDTNKLENLNIESDLVKKLYNYVAEFSYYDELIVYQSEIVSEKNMSNSLKLLTIFNNLKKEDATRIEYQYENEYIPKREHVIYSKDIIQDKAKEIFGANVNIEHQNASPYDGHSIIYKNNEYDSFDYEGGGVVPWESSIRFLISAEKDENGTIYLYDKYVHLVEVENIKSDGINWAGSYDIYTSSDRKEKLASKVDFEENHIYSGLENIASGTINYNKKYIQNIEKYLGKELMQYKHTYKQNSDGTYYWYSTEPIK